MMSSITELNLFHSQAIVFLYVCSIVSMQCYWCNGASFIRSMNWNAVYSYFTWLPYCDQGMSHAVYSYFTHAPWNVKHELQTMLPVKMLFVVWSNLNWSTWSSHKCCWLEMCSRCLTYIIYLVFFMTCHETNPQMNNCSCDL
jgi:hypothetical protein